MPVDLEDARRRLKGWACHYRDRARQGQAGSAEKLWRSPQCWEAPRPRPDFPFLEAVETQRLLQLLPTPNHRALSWRYVAPWLPQGIALRALTRRLGYRVTPRIYDDLVSIGEHRLAVLIEQERELAELRTLIQRVAMEKSPAA